MVIRWQAMGTQAGGNLVDGRLGKQELGVLGPVAKHSCICLCAWESVPGRVFRRRFCKFPNQRRVAFSSFPVITRLFQFPGCVRNKPQCLTAVPKQTLCLRTLVREWLTLVKQDVKAKTCERIVHRHGAILLILRECSGFNPPAVTTLRMEYRAENR